MVQDIKDAAKEQIELEENSYGHYLSDDDCVTIFKEQLARELLHLLLVQKLDTLTDQQKAKVKTIEKKLATMGKKERYHTIKADFLFQINRVTRAATRRTILKPDQERLHLHLTWQDIDFMLYVCGLGTEELKQYVADVDKWLRCSYEISRAPKNKENPMNLQGTVMTMPQNPMNSHSAHHIMQKGMKSL